MHASYDVKDALRKADAELLSIRDTLHMFERKEEGERGESSRRQDMDEEEGEY